MLRYFCLIYITFFTVCFTNQALAKQQCEVELVHGLVITDEVIRIIENDQTRVQINNNNQLFVRGHLIELSEKNSQLLTQYSLGIRSTVPELVNLATDGVNLGLSAIEQLVQGVSEQESAVLKNQLKYVEHALRNRFTRGDDFFFIAPQSLSKLDDFFANEVRQKLHAAVHGSLGALLIALGDAFDSQEGDIEARINDMGRRMDIISQAIDNSLEKKARKLDEKAAEYCECLNKLDITESALQRAVPELLDFDLVHIKSNA